VRDGKLAASALVLLLISGTLGCSDLSLPGADDRSHRGGEDTSADPADVEVVPSDPSPRPRSDASTAPDAAVDAAGFDLGPINAQRARAGQPAMVWDEQVAAAASTLSRQPAELELTAEMISAALETQLGVRPASNSLSVHGTGTPEQLHARTVEDDTDGRWLGDFDRIGIGVATTGGSSRVVYLLVQSAEARREAAVDALPTDPVGHTVALINATRAEQGLAPLVRDAHAEQIARRWTQQMAASGELEHNPDFHEQLTVGIAGLAASAENVGMASEGLEAIHQGFVDSPGHYANLIGDYERVGVGVVVDERGEVWVTHNFVRLQ